MHIVSTDKLNRLYSRVSRVYIYADMAELADALDSGSSDFTVIQVQVLLSAPKNTQPVLRVGVFL